MRTTKPGKVRRVPKRESVDRLTRERLRRHLLAIMAEHRLNARKLALRLGVSPGTISSILSEDRGMGLDVFVKLHREFKISANHMLDSEPEEHPKRKGVRPTDTDNKDKQR